MEHQSYVDWADNHATTFGFGADHQAMLYSWFSVFRGLGYTLAELRAATVALMRPGSVPKWPGDHLEAVQQAALEARHAADRDRRLRALPAPGEVDDWGECVKCQNTGIVEVPHPARLKDWPHPYAYTAGVICDCSVGRRRLESEETDDVRRKRRQDRGQRPMTLAEYDRLCPDGRERLRRWREGCTEHAKALRAMGTDGPIDKDLDAAIENAFAAATGRPCPHPDRRSKWRR